MAKYFLLLIVSTCCFFVTAHATENARFVPENTNAEATVEVGYLEYQEVRTFAIRFQGEIYISESMPSCYQQIRPISRDFFLINSSGCGSGLEMKFSVISIQNKELKIIDSMDPGAYNPIFHMRNGKLKGISLVAGPKPDAWSAEWGWVLPRKLEINFVRDKFFFEKTSQSRLSTCKTLQSCILKDMNSHRYDFKAMNDLRCDAYSDQTYRMAKKNDLDLCRVSPQMLAHMPMLSISEGIEFKKTLIQ